jgi:hypothetical protein
MDTGWVVPRETVREMQVTQLLSVFAECRKQKFSYRSFIYSPTDALVSCLKETILKFSSKQLRHVPMQSHHHQEAH